MAEDMFEQLLRHTREDYDSLGIPVTGKIKARIRDRHDGPEH